MMTPAFGNAQLEVSQNFGNDDFSNLTALIMLLMFRGEPSKPFEFKGGNMVRIPLIRSRCLASQIRNGETAPKTWL